MIKKIIFIIISLIVTIQSSFAISRTPNCAKLYDPNCVNSCTVVDYPSTVEILARVTADRFGLISAVLEIPFIEAFSSYVGSIFNMIDTQSNLESSSLIGTPNVIQTTQNNGLTSYVHVTDGAGNLCGSPPANGLNSQYPPCTQVAPSNVDGCSLFSNNVSFTLNITAGITPPKNYTLSPGDTPLTLLTPITSPQAPIGPTPLPAPYPLVIRAAIVDGDKVCAQFLPIMEDILLFQLGSDANQLLWQNIGCKYLAPTPAPLALTQSVCLNGSSCNSGTFVTSPTGTSQQAGCFAGSACASAALSNSKNQIMPITAVAVECIEDAITKVFVTGCNSSNSDLGSKQPYMNTISSFQKSMQTAVMLALTLYIIIFGIRVVIGDETPNKGEIFMFIMKFILVVYFSIGFVPGGSASTSLTSSTNGVQDLIIPGFQALSNTLSQFVFSAAGSSTCDNGGGALCSFDSTTYADGYGYLSLWDSLDCRIAYYLGFVNGNDAAEAALALSGILALPLFLILSGQFVFFIFTVTFAIFLISITIFLVNIFAIAFICLGITSYFAPIFVPMALFKPTKPFFDSWLKLLFSFALQPVVITAFIAIMVTVFDQVMYGSCCWVKEGIFWITGPQSIYANAADYATCNNSIGSMLFFGSGDNVKNITLNLIVMSIQGSVFSPALLKPLFTVLLFGFLFYYFAQNIGALASDIVGGPNLGDYSVGATAFFDAAIEAATKKSKEKDGAKTASGNTSGGGNTGSGAAKKG